MPLRCAPQVEVLRCTNLIHWSPANPYVILHFGRKWVRLKTFKQNTDPVWEVPLEFEVRDLSELLKVAVFYDKQVEHSFIKVCAHRTASVVLSVRPTGGMGWWVQGHKKVDAPKMPLIFRSIQSFFFPRGKCFCFGWVGGWFGRGGGITPPAPPPPVDKHMPAHGTAPVPRRRVSFFLAFFLFGQCRRTASWFAMDRRRVTVGLTTN